MNQQRFQSKLQILAVASVMFLPMTVAWGQTVPRPKPLPRRSITQLKIKPLPVRPKLKQHLQLRGKKKLSRVMQRQIRRSISYLRTGEPRLTLRKGKKVVLERVEQPGPKPSLAILRKSRVLDPALNRYRDYITKTPYLRDPKLKLPPGARLLRIVSHKSRQTSIKDQGNDRGTCVAQAAVAGLESWYKWKDNVTRDLSEQHTFEVLMDQEGHESCENVGLQTWRAADYLVNNRVCDSWAYTTSVPSCDVAAPNACATNTKFGHTAATTFFNEEFGGVAATSATNTNYLESLLDQGHDVIFGTLVAGPDWSTGTIDTGTIDVYLTADGDPVDPYAGHAMLLIGYNRPFGYFEFKNSWGTDQGHDGYVRLSYEYVQTYGKYGYYINGATPRKPRRIRNSPLKPKSKTPIRKR